MENAIELLYILPYNIPEELFKQKIGTGDYLKELKEKDYVEISYKGICVKESFKNNNKIEISKERKDKLHNDLINEFYIPKLKEVQIIDYENLINYYILYINISYHYIQLSKYDEAFTSLTTIIKKMQYWGMRNEIVDVINQFDEKELCEENRYLKLYYDIFLNIQPFFYDSETSEDCVQQFNYLEEVKNKDLLLYLEVKNLEGIYYQLIKEDIKHAISIYKTSIDLISDKNDLKLNLVCGKIYENLSFCYQQLYETEESIKAMDYAYEYLVNSDDPYEKAKMLYNKMAVYYNYKKPEPSWISCFGELSDSLENYRFPDIERNLSNLLSNIELSDSNNYNDYFKYKTHAMMYSRVLYQDYFAIDFMSMFNVIVNNKDSNDKDLIVEGLRYPLEFLKDIEMEDESLFIELIVSYLKKEEYMYIKKQIKNLSLLELFEDEIESKK